MTRRRRHSALATLGWFWLAVVVVVGAGVIALAALGPPPRPAPRQAARQEPKVARAAAPDVSKTPAVVAKPATLAAKPAVLTPEPAKEQTPSPPQPRSAPAVVPPPIPVQVVRPIAPPDPALLEPAPGNPKRNPKRLLPRIGPDGRSSITAYAGAFDAADPRPKIGLIVASIGLSGKQGKDVIDELPAPVTLAFSPYAQDPAALLAQARAKGHEFLISLPLEPSGYPLNSAGDESLLVGAPKGQNLSRLDWTLGRIAGYVGATGGMDGMYGERFSAEPDLLDKLEQRLAARGLLYIDARPGKPNPEVAIGRTVDVIVDQPPIPSVIAANLAKLENIARLKGSALGIVGWAGPRTLQALVAWVAKLPQAGLVLAPVTALAEKPTVPTPPVPPIEGAR